MAPEAPTVGTVESEFVHKCTRPAAMLSSCSKKLAQEFKEGLDQVKGLLTLFADQDKKLAPLVDVVDNLQITTEGSTIILKSEVGEEIIEKHMKKN